MVRRLRPNDWNRGADQARDPKSQRAELWRTRKGASAGDLPQFYRARIPSRRAARRPPNCRREKGEQTKVTATSAAVAGQQTPPLQLANQLPLEVLHQIGIDRTRNQSPHALLGRKPHGFLVTKANDLHHEPKASCRTQELQSATSHQSRPVCREPPNDFRVVIAHLFGTDLANREADDLSADDSAQKKSRRHLSTTTRNASSSLSM